MLASDDEQAMEFCQPKSGFKFKIVAADVNRLIILWAMDEWSGLTSAATNESGNGSGSAHSAFRIPHWQRTFFEFILGWTIEGPAGKLLFLPMPKQFLWIDGSDTIWMLN